MSAAVQLLLVQDASQSIRDLAPDAEWVMIYKPEAFSLVARIFLLLQKKLTKEGISFTKHPSLVDGKVVEFGHRGCPSWLANALSM